jgi:hypothetical protein
VKQREFGSIHQQKRGENNKYRGKMLNTELNGMEQRKS